MSSRPSKLRSILAGLACIAVAAAVAGELEPPVPPGTPTMKPLDLVETRRPITADMLPLTIAEPGTSWYLVHDISTTGTGITVAADDVTIDLNGFVLAGGTGVGIREDQSGAPFPSNTTVKNGTVRGWASQGVRLGNNSTVTGVRAMSNKGTGIEVGGSSLVGESIADSNEIHGIVAGPGSVVRNCVGSYNDQNGIWGHSGVLIVHNLVTQNLRNGIRVDDACHVLENLARSSSLGQGTTFSGIWVVGERNRIEGNTLVDNRNGITVDGSNNLVVRNSASENWDSNFTISGSSTGNMVGTIRTSLTSAGPWDNLCHGFGCP